MSRLLRFQIALGLLLACLRVEAGVLVAPTRLILEDGARHAEFTLVNKGNRTEHYRISLQGRRMDPDGRVVRADEPRAGERFAHELIRFSPRRVVLPPGEPQTVRILVRRPDGLAPGEYRSHLVFQQVPDAPPAAVGSATETRQRLSVSLTPIFGISVPVIVRQGTLRGVGRLRELELARDGTEIALRLRIEREGERSLFGDFVVHHETPAGERSEVGRTHSVALYTPNAERTLSFPLKGLDGRWPRTGRLVVEYRDAEPGANRLITEAALDLAEP